MSLQQASFLMDLWGMVIQYKHHRSPVYIKWDWIYGPLLLTGHFYVEKNVSIILEQKFIYSGAYITLINLLSKNLNRKDPRENGKEQKKTFK